MSADMDIPGQVSYWLSRASRSELLRVQKLELGKGLGARWRLITLIDAELNKRDASLERVKQEIDDLEN